MLKYSVYVIVIATAITWNQVLFAEIHENHLVRDTAIDFTIHSWKTRNDIPEVRRSKAIEQIKAIKNQEWKGLMNFFFQVLDVFEKFKAKKSVKSTANTKYHREDNNYQTTEEIIKELFSEMLLAGATSSEEPILERKFKDAMKIKFKTMDDFGKHCITIYEKVTGRKSPAEG